MRWNEKYRPRNFSECVGSEKILRQIEGLATRRISQSLTGDLPHFLLHGMPGTGKTTTAYLIAQEITGGDLSSVTEINASSDRGIDVMKATILKAIRNMTLNGRPRVVIMDEADGLTKEAQNVLRRPLETTANTVFIFCLNEVKAIQDTLLSRCAVFHFQPVDLKSMTDRLRWILKEEGITMAEREIVDIATSAHGDLRTAINELQKVAATGERQQEIDALVSEAMAKT